jgi:hypothetical protein
MNKIIYHNYRPASNVFHIKRAVPYGRNAWSFLWLFVNRLSDQVLRQRSEALRVVVFQWFF